ncbi:MATE family efflux transporter [Pseudomonas sp. M47T1]|uniref:MATE family efflux transporter n=1 Tax=Pseudomonas sp. M47T1 TaxID=1179778 RepID=UPI0012FC435D|nr:MATE family efflux transporter [Pseudomonas sp. M47T1]
MDSKIARLWSAPMLDIYKLAIPLGLANLLMLANTIVDTIMLGAVNAETLAGATLGIQLFLLLVVFGDGVVLAFAPMYTKSLGSDDKSGQAAVMRGTILLCLGLSLMAIGVMYAAEHLFVLFGIDTALSAISGDYNRIAALSVFPMLLSIAGWELASAHDKASCVLVASILGFLANAALNWVFIYGNLGFTAMGVSGASLSTLISSLVILGTIVVYLRKEVRILFSCKISMALCFKSAIQVLKLGSPIGVIEIATVGFFASSTYLISIYGAEVLAAHAIAYQVTELAIVFVLGFGEAATIKIGLLLGTLRNQELKEMVRNLILGCISVSVLLCALMILLSTDIPKLYFGFESSSLERPQNLATQLILIGATFTILDALQIVYLGILRGLRDTAIPMMYVLVGYWAVGVPGGLLLSGPAGLGPQGIWYGLTIGLLAVCVGLFWRLKRRMIEVMEMPLASSRNGVLNAKHLS